MLTHIHVPRDITLIATFFTCLPSSFLSGLCVHDMSSRDSSVGIAIGFGLDGRSEIRIPGGAKEFCSSDHPDWVWGPPSLLFDRASSS